MDTGDSETPNYSATDVTKVRGDTGHICQVLLGNLCVSDAKQKD